VAHLQGALQERLEERRKPRLGRKDFGKHLARVFGDSVRSGLKKSGGMTQQVYFGLRKREPDELSGAVEVITEPTVFEGFR